MIYYNDVSLINSTPSPFENDTNISSYALKLLVTHQTHVQSKLTTSFIYFVIITRGYVFQEGNILRFATE